MIRKKAKKITLFGGTGFFGRHIVHHLARANMQIDIYVPNPNVVLPLKMAGRIGQIGIMRADIYNKADIEAAMDEADIVIDMSCAAGEKGNDGYSIPRYEGAVNIAQAAQNAGIEKLIHISAIEMEHDEASRHYAQSRIAGEQAVQAACEHSYILRPALIIGPEDMVCERFAALAQISPFLPLPGSGKTRIQPISVYDVAACVGRLCEDDAPPIGIYELGGPHIYDFAALVRLILRETGHMRLLLPVPIFGARLMAFFMQFLPRPFLTGTLIRGLAADNIVCAAHKDDMMRLGVTPVSIETVLPQCLARFRGAREAVKE